MLGREARQDCCNILPEAAERSYSTSNGCVTWEVRWKLKELHRQRYCQLDDVDVHARGVVVEHDNVRLPVFQDVVDDVLVILLD